MDIIISNLPLISMMIAAGIVGGILAGLLGVGGGIVIVPVLEFALGLVGVDPNIRMHIAVATSLATIILTSLSSSRAHYKKKAIDLLLAKKWGVPIFLGSALGTWIASQLDSGVLSAIFGIIALIVAIKMMLPARKYAEPKQASGNSFFLAVPTLIGGLSSMMGIGGGTLSVPVLTILHHPIHRAVGTSALFGLIISIPATVGFMVNGQGVAGLPFGSIGYVNIVGFMMISPLTMLTAPFGAKIAHKLSQRHLSILFGSFLFLVAVRMIYRATLG